MEDPILLLLNEDLEKHWGLPGGVLSQGRITHFASDAKRAVWTADGGVVACPEAALAQTMAAVVGAHRGTWSETVLPALREALGRRLAEASSLDVGLYCCTSSIAPKNEWWDAVEMLAPGAEGIPDLHEPEHVFAIREGGFAAVEPQSPPPSSSKSKPPAIAWNRRSFLAEKIQFHAVGAGTHPDCRNRGLGKAVVSALLDHIASEGGVALWNCDVLNVPSLRLARSVGFVEWLWKFDWGESEEEMQVRRAVIRATGQGTGE